MTPNISGDTEVISLNYRNNFLENHDCPWNVISRRLLEIIICVVIIFASLRGGISLIKEHRVVKVHGLACYLNS